MRRTYANIPFAPARLPFFYGWAIIPLGAIGIIMSIPGQTMGVSVFTDYLIDALELTRVQLSAAYMCGTVTSACLLTFAGYVYDRIGARLIVPFAALFLGGMLFLLSASPDIAALSSSWSPLSSLIFRFFVIYLTFLGIRFFGQGILTMVCRNMTMKWFDTHRGLASGISGMMVSPCFAAAPRIFDALISSYNWQMTCHIIAFVLIFVFAPFALIFYRDTPEECGLQQDGERSSSDSATALTQHVHRQFTLREAVKTRAFWVYTLSTTLFGMFITGFIFNITDIFAEYNLSREYAYSFFIPSAVIAMGLRPVAGWVCDHIPLRFFLVILLLTITGYTLSVAHLDTKGIFVILVICNSIAGVMFQILMNVTWPRLFGREHLGAVSGLAMSLNVGGSALGPWIYSFLYSYTDTYATASYVMLSLCIILLVSSLFATNPQKNLHR
jgi:MFS transporter, OFA family, oxalate/formate antiporter